MKISREIKTAILVLGTIALFIWGYSFLKGTNLFDNSTKYYVEYKNVEGLAPSASVTINGLVVGKVSRIDLDPTSGNLKVELTMTHKEIKISKQSLASIYSPGLIAGKAVKIDPVFGSTDFAVSGDFIQGAIEPELTDKVMDEFIPLKIQLEKILGNANKMLVSLNAIMNEETQANLRQSVVELQSTIKGVNTLVATTTPKLNQTIDNVNVITANFKGVTSKLDALDINTTFTKLDNASAQLETMLTDINQGKGSVGLLLKDEQLYNNLQGASFELEQLMRDLKENPKRYVHFSLFGKKPAPYQGDVAVQQTVNDSL